MIELEKLHFDDSINYKLYIKLFDQKFGIPIFNDIEKFKSHDEVEINLSKIFYFFTTDNSNLKQILKNEEVDFRIVINDDWHNPLAQCVTTCLSFFENETATKTARVKNTLNFFSNDLKYFKCQVYVGLNNDGEILSLDNISFYPFKGSNNLYLSEQDYFSYHPLPDDWYELFIPPESTMEDYYDLNLDSKIDKIIYDLEFDQNIKVRPQKEEEKIYDPYDTLVQVQEKKTLISKIKSIPVIQDKKYIDHRKLSTKTRPQTSTLMTKFNLMPVINEKKEQVYTSGISGSNTFLQNQSNSKINYVDNDMESSKSSKSGLSKTYKSIRTVKSAKSNKVLMFQQPDSYNNSELQDEINEINSGKQSKK
jgi:hypothetical protein